MTGSLGQSLRSWLGARVRNCMPAGGSVRTGPVDPPATTFWCPELDASRARFRGARRMYRSRAETRAARNEHYRLLRYKKRCHAKNQQFALIHASYQEPAAFWREVRGARDTASVPSDMRAWVEHFTSVFDATVDQVSLPDGLMPAEVEDCLAVLLPSADPANVEALGRLNEPITAGEVDYAISRLRKGKSADSQGLTCECVQLGALDGLVEDDDGTGVENVLTPCLLALFNRLLGGDPVPRPLTLNTLTPVFKGKGGRSVLSGYRGIAVGSVIGKLYERILHDRLSEAVDELGLRAETQSGFRPGRGTLDALFTLQHMADLARVNGSPIYVVFVDFKMAFDVCDRECLSRVWESMGISGPFLEALRALYMEITMLVKVKSRLSPPIATTRGTKQGSELSPLIFGLFIERLRPLLAHRCPGMGPLLGNLRVPEQFYADDVQLATERPEDMQCLLDALEIFCHMFKMALNVQKTVGMVLRPAGLALAALAARCRWVFHGQAIQVLDSSTYLGLVFCGIGGAGVSAATALAVPARKAMGALLARARQMQIDQSQLLCRLFDALVDPILSYGCQIWGPAVCARLLTHADAVDRKRNPGEGVHIDFLRAACSLPDCSHKWTVLAEYGRRPLLVRWLQLSARFWGRVRGMDEGRLVREAMTANIELFLQHRSQDCWVAQFLHCLVSLDCLSAHDVAACVTAEDVWDLTIEEEAVRLQLGEWCDALWAEGSVAADPREADGAHVVATTYTQWVWGRIPEGPPQHFTAVLGYHPKCTLVRLRVTGYPLRISTGRNEGRGSSRPGQRGGREAVGTNRALREPPSRGRGIPREERVCKLCQAEGRVAVEDLKHFLLECPAYAAIKHTYAVVFLPPPQSPHMFLNQPDQYAVAHAVCTMLRHRASCLRG